MGKNKANRKKEDEMRRFCSCNGQNPYNELRLDDKLIDLFAMSNRVCNTRMSSNVVNFRSDKANVALKKIHSNIKC